jgi:hypothetical protein
MAHTCHAIACERNVPPMMLMCGFHWFKVPRKLRERVWATYRDGQCDTLDPSSAYCQAAKAAVIAVAEKEGRVIDPKEPKILLYDMVQVSDEDDAAHAAGGE